MMADSVIIDDNNWINFLDVTVDGEKKGRGYRRVRESIRNAHALPFEALGVALIDEADLDDHIRQREKDHATLEEFFRELGGKPLDQRSTNYCWANATVQAAAFAWLRETGQYVRPSAASVAAPSTGFRNVGGFGQKALQYMVEHGWCTEEEWPNAAIDRKYWTESNKQAAMRRRPLEYVRIQTWQENYSAQMAGFVVSSGLGWWRHQINNIGLQLKTHRQRILNSWGESWSDAGYGWLDGTKRWDNDGVVIYGLQPFTGH